MVADSRKKSRRARGDPRARGAGGEAAPADGVDPEFDEADLGDLVRAAAGGRIAVAELDAW